MLQRILITLLALLAPLPVLAQTRFLSSPEEAQKVAESIVANVAGGNTATALKILRPLSVIPGTEFDIFEAQMNAQQASLLRQYGPAQGYEFVREDRFGSRLVRNQFVIFHEKSALRWLFIFYKTEKGWVFTHIFFDGNSPTFFTGAGS